MAAAAAALLCFLTVRVFGSVSAQDQINIPAEPGQTITLSCDAVSFRPIRVVDWSRTDQNPVNTILFQNGKPHPDILDLSYKGRVELKDRQNGDVSLILKNVTTADSGTYECHIQRGTNHSGTGVYENKLLSIIYLDVSPPPGDQAGGAGGLTAALVVLTVALVIILAVIPVIVWKRKNSSPPPPPDEEAEKPPLIKEEIQNFQ
ncbi:megakaryocyte and platelet inhibitory receptor G6b-like [Kryptolebias marmoratus]|uniref:megakaryocyte and platelet inhibitory receptor G6b-like n=1 Tax=Kryptolebias marmoratus TaxID=37003 RepID=UPI0007F926C2|nr:megakaryocyte and platelet inhibitory receptor G6b-like [Kryptolebias marmoratus]